jgi:nicotinamide riboside kinase
MIAANAFFITGTAYAGKSTMVKLLAEKHNGIACRENYHEELMDDRLDPEAFPCLCYTRDL